MTSRDRRLMAVALAPAAVYVLALLAVFLIRPDFLRFEPLWLALTIVVTIIPPAYANFLRIRGRRARNAG